jgi:pyruvate dehydrogenase E2 component (dihydrolipoamide acetyltransferase)
MAEEVYIPKFGQTVEEVTLINWLVNDGDPVVHGQAVLEVETDKAVFSVEAAEKGFIHLGPFKAGDVLPVLTVVAVIGTQADVFQGPAKTISEAGAEQDPSMQKQVERQSVSPVQMARPTERIFSSPRARRLAREIGIDLASVQPSGGGGTRIRERDVAAAIPRVVRISPLAQRMAEDKQVDLRFVRGTGSHGEITRHDVEAAITGNASRMVSGMPGRSERQLPDAEITERIPLKGVRGLIAERMAASVRSTARVTLLMDADATAFAALRESLKARYEASWGFAPAIHDMLARICAPVLRQFPYMNARLNGDVIERLTGIHIGIAVDTERGLVVPVMRDADQKSLHTIASEFRQRVEEARSGRILPEHLTGGTFTITNLGMYDVDGFTPVINLPEAAILGVGRIAPRVAAVDGEMAIRQMMTLSLAFDHRLVDGAPAARFLQAVKNLIEMPDEAALVG